MRGVRDKVEALAFSIVEGPVRVKAPLKVKHREDTRHEDIIDDEYPQTVFVTYVEDYYDEELEQEIEGHFVVGVSLDEVYDQALYNDRIYVIDYLKNSKPYLVERKTVAVKVNENKEKRKRK